MTLIRTDEIQTAWITALKANTTIVAELDTADEIREINWKGSNFTYPNLRVEITSNTPSTDGRSEICLALTNTSIYAYSEEASSLQANQIAGIIANEYHDKHGLNYSNIAFTHIVADIIPAIAVTERLWRSQVNLVSTARRV